MPNRFFEPGVGRAEKVKGLFAKIAPRYDLVNDLQSFGLHRLWKRRVVHLAGVRDGVRALDVCCGTGDLTFGLARRGAETVGLDFSEPMLAIAERRKSKLPPEQLSAGRVKFAQGDAQQLPFPEESFDIVTTAYGLRNLADWEAGLREMQRVAKPGGRLLVLDFAKPDNALWRWIYFGYLRLFVPVLGCLCCGDAAAYAYILESLAHYPAQHGVAATMRQLGLSNVRTFSLLGGVMSINYGVKAEGRK